MVVLVNEWAQTESNCPPLFKAKILKNMLGTNVVSYLFYEAMRKIIYFHQICLQIFLCSESEH